MRITKKTIEDQLTALERLTGINNVRVETYTGGMVRLYSLKQRENGSNEAIKVYDYPFGTPEGMCKLSEMYHRLKGFEKALLCVKFDGLAIK